ncbi:dehydrogenase [Methylobacterium segetis]|uniref:GHMP family kinase ATP-binding protein n=1 Tax=Methylobacterium segetis TaxID=2488750 RepID=UPI0010460902|nr:dehydrogenase [Methylobacterium segetis]
MTQRAIRSRAPLRLGLAGGGTDLSPFCDAYGGVVLNCTIDRYAYAFIAPRDDGRTVFRARDIGREEEHRAGAMLDTDDGLRLHRCTYNHFLGGLAARGVEVGRGLTLTTVVDAPPGSGLGSSSALVVAICEAFRVYGGEPLGLYDLARLAVEIERVRLRLDGGRQDHYAAAFGGMNFIEFFGDGRAIVNPLRVDRSILNEFEASLVLCFTGTSRDSERIIREQTANMRRHDARALDALFALKSAAIDMKQAVLSGEIGRIAEILAESWASKKRTAGAVSSGALDALFEAGLAAGARAGKISGAGGGGFMMFLVAPEDRRQLIEGLNRAGGQASPVHLTSKGVETWLQPRAS